MNIDSMVIAIHVMVLVTRLWTVHSMEEVLEVQITKLDAGLVITLAMLLLIATLLDAIIAVALVIKPKLVLVQEDNQ